MCPHGPGASGRELVHISVQYVLILSLIVTICNHAHQKLFTFITCPCSLSLSVPLHCLQDTYSVLQLHDQYVIKLPHFSALIQHNVKLQDCPDYA
jgi:hypothetical protein